MASNFVGVCFVDVCLFLCLFLLLLLTWSEAGHQGGEGKHHQDIFMEKLLLLLL